jgi:uncharacterized OB-fold protein
MTQTMGMLSLLRCKACNRLDTAMRVVCAGCLSTDLRPVGNDGSGTVATYTTIRRAPTAFRDQAPYDVVVVDLDAGLRMTGRLDKDSAPPSVGARVRVLHSAGADTVFTVENS